MDEIDYKQPSNPRYFMTVHSAWCPPKRSDFLEITLKKRELSDPCWVDINSNKITYTNVGEIIKMSVKCNEDIELFEDVVFRMYPEGSDISTTQPEATVRGSNINGIAESEELCWGVKKQGNPPDSPTKYFFTAQAKRSPYIVSDVFEIKLPEFSNLSWKKDNENIEIAIDNEYMDKK